MGSSLETQHHASVSKKGPSGIASRMCVFMFPRGPFLPRPVRISIDNSLVFPPPEEPAPQDSDARPGARPQPTHMHIVTANVQSLKDAPANPFNPSGHASRRQFMYDQMQRLHIDVICLQETRSRQGRWDTAGVLTWRSGACQGQYGCEVWIRPTILDPPLKLQDFRIVSAGPRHLLITCINPRLPLSICSAHAPHAERPDAEAEAFWRELRESLLRAPSNRGLVLGIDANGDFTSSDEASCLIGEYLAEHDPTRNDGMLLEFCLHLGLEAPATFAEHQIGHRWSWEHSSGRHKRLDHVLFRPGPWTHSLTSQAADFDLATANRDHVALRVRTTLCLPGQRAPVPASRRCTGQEVAQHGSSLWNTVSRQVRKASLSAGEQVQTFISAYASWIRTLPGRPPLVPKQPYISDRTRGALMLLRDWRAQLRHVRQQRDILACQQCFRRWARRTGSTVSRLHAHCLRLQIAALERQVQQAAAHAHCLARQDKLRPFEQLTAKATVMWHDQGRPLDAITHLKWASRRSAERRAVHAAGGYEIDDALEEQFRAQEGAQRVTPEQLQSVVRDWWQQPVSPCPAAVPTLLQVEAAARAQKGGKAPGPDAIPNEVWKLFPVHTGQWLWPVCVHIALTCREPFHFKRAIVCALYKKGPAALPENYRSIALLNGIAKVWHGHLPKSIGSSILHRYDPLQLGGRAGIPVSFAVAAFRAASDLCAAQGRCEAVLFVDIQAAYYEASRVLLFQGDPDLSLPPGEHLSHLSSLVSVLVQEGALQMLGVPPEEIALLQDCVAASHWTLSGSRNVYLASRGSRPGDGLADILFGALFAIALRHIRQVCQSEGWAHFSAGALIGKSDEVLPLGWADDLAILSDYASPTDLQENFPRVAVVALSTLRFLRFRVNLGPGKTEAMLHIRGARAKEVRGQMLGLDPCLHLCTGDKLRLTPEYRYLGVVQTPKDTGRRDTELLSWCRPVFGPTISGTFRGPLGASCVRRKTTHQTQHTQRM